MDGVLVCAIPTSSKQRVVTRSLHIVSPTGARTALSAAHFPRKTTPKRTPPTPLSVKIRLARSRP